MVVSLKCFFFVYFTHNYTARFTNTNGEGIFRTRGELQDTWRGSFVVTFPTTYIYLYEVTIHSVSRLKKKEGSNKTELYVPSLTCWTCFSTYKCTCICVCVRVKFLRDEGYTVLCFTFMRCFLYSCVTVGVSIRTVCTSGYHTSATAGRVFGIGVFGSTDPWCKFQWPADTAHPEPESLSSGYQNVCCKHNVFGTTSTVGLY